MGRFLGLLSVLIFSCTVATYSLSKAQAEGERIPISFVVAPDVLINYQNFLAGRPFQEVMDIDTKLPRDSLEVFITLYVLHLGGLNFLPEFVSTPSLERHISLLRSGSVAMSAALVDKLDLDSVDGIYSSPSLFKGTAKMAGLFTAPGNERALSAISRADIKSLTAISNKSWRSDWKALQTVEVAKLISVADWTTMCRMVKAGRVDFLLAPRQNNRTGKGILQTPVGPLFQMQPFAISILAHRSFAISEKHPDAERIKNALVAGKEKIDAHHFIQDAVRQATAASSLPEMLIILNKNPAP